MLASVKIKFFADFIEKELGIIYSEPVYYQLQQRLDKVAEHVGLANAEELYVRATSEGITGDFRAYLLDIATNNETSFFRDPSIFAAIESHIIPALKTDFANAISYRVWSAASSFGQEPYSVAMLAFEAKKKDPTLPRFDIKATDISDAALRRAKAAHYTQLEVQRGLSASRLVNYFTKCENSDWQLNNEISSMVEFSKKNLLESFSLMGKFHVILCRYVLIYQDTEKKKEIIRNLIQCLHPKGFLLLGGSESALGLSNEIAQAECKGAVFYRKK